MRKNRPLTFRGVIKTEHPGSMPICHGKPREEQEWSSVKVAVTKYELIHRAQSRVVQTTARCAELREQRRELLLVRPISMTLVHLLAVFLS